jgi:hypothetical protein
MINIYSKISTITVIVLCLYGCTDIIEPNISREKVKLLAPVDSLVTLYSTQTFWWEPVKNANLYSLQIVSPTFDYIERLIIDTVVEANQFSISLFPGQYQWQVKAYNYSYTTEYTTNTLFVDSTLDLSQQVVVLVSPINNDTNNVSHIELRWEDLYNANKYIFVVENQEGTVSYDTIITNTNFIDNVTDGSYKWKVKAFNSYSETVFFQRNFFHYTYIPEAPILILPANDDEFTTSETIKFSWRRDQVTIPSIKDSIYIANDSLFSDFIVKDLLVFPLFEIAFEEGVYYWRVKSIDKAGNKSVYSETRKLTIYN